MAIFCAIVILEHRFKMNSSDLNSSAIFIKNICESFFNVSTLKIFTSCQKSIILSNGWNTDSWYFIDTFRRECFIYWFTESIIVEKLFRIASLISVCNCVILFISKVEIQHTKNWSKLCFSNMTLTEFIIVNEKLFNSNSLHNNHWTETILNIIRITWYINTRLLITIMNHINRVSIFCKEWWLYGHWHSSRVYGSRWWILRSITRENVLRSV